MGFPYLYACAGRSRRGNCIRRKNPLLITAKRWKLNLRTLFFQSCCVALRMLLTFPVLLSLLQNAGDNSWLLGAECIPAVTLEPVERESPMWGLLAGRMGCGTCWQAGTAPSNKYWCVRKKKKKGKKRERERERKPPAFF